MDASRRGREPRPGIQCPDWCGPVHVKGVRKEDITCPCGYGYYSKKTGEFISGDLVRAGKVPPKDADRITVPEKCWNDPARGGRDGQVHELPGHEPFAYEPPLSLFSNEARSYSPGHVAPRPTTYAVQPNPQQPYSARISARHEPSPDGRRPTYERQSISDQPSLSTTQTHDPQDGRGSLDRHAADPPLLTDYGPDNRHSPPRRYDERISAWTPSEGIEFDVISNDIQSYLGPDASVERMKHPKDGRPGYLVRAAITLTTPILSDLKADSNRWLSERRDRKSTDYESSQTHKLRLKNSSSSSPPLPQSSRPHGSAATSDRTQPSTNYQLSREQQIRYAPDINSTPRSSSTAVSVPQEPGKRESLFGHQQETIPSASQRDSHDQFNDLKRNAEVRVARRLKEGGETQITKAQFDRLVSQEMERSQSISISTDTAHKRR